MQKLNKFFLIGLAAVLIFSLALPQSVWASLIPGPFDYFDMVSQNVEEIAGPIMGKVLTTFIFYAAGLIALSATANILDKVIVAQPGWIDLQTPMVQEGWHFTAGLANMLIILILIFLAFQVILKIDTIATKKAFIRLLIVALLLNFSILFVEVALDVTDVFYNSILSSISTAPGSDSLFGSVVNVLTGGTSRIVRNFTVMIGGWMATFLIPGAGAIREFIIGIVFVAMYLPMIIGWAIESILFFLLSGVFLVFIFVFVARVYIIQLLAILSPLAFVALILPQTEKYWKEWLDHLVQWIIVGMFLLFFLALWCAGIQGLMPTEMDNPWLAAIPFLSWKGITKQMLFYLITIIYFAILLFVSKRATPAIANEIMGLAKNIGGTVWSAGVKPLAGGIGKQAGWAAADQATAEKKYRAEAEAARQEGREPPTMSRKQKIGMAVGKWAAPPIRLSYRLRGTTPEREVGKEIESEVADLESKFGKDTKSAMTGGLPLGWRPASLKKKAALGLYLAKTGGGGDKGLGQLSEAQLEEAVATTAQFASYKVEDIAKHRPELIDNPKVKNLVREAMVSKGTSQGPNEKFKDHDIDEMVSAGETIDNEDIKELLKSDAGRIKIIRKAAFKKAARAMETADIPNLDISTLENEDFQEAVARYRTDVGFIRRIGEEKGQEYVDKIRAKMEGLGAKEVAKTNLAVLRSAVYNPGFKSIFSPITSAAKKEEIEALEREIKKLREAIGAQRKTTTPPSPGTSGVKDQSSTRGTSGAEG